MRFIVIEYLSPYIENKTSSNTNPTKTEEELWCSGKVSSSCSSNITRPVTMVTNPEIIHE
jgi:hypothetical protein